MRAKYTPVDERLYGYLLAHRPPERGELEKLRLKTQTMPDAAMQIVPEQGHLLALLVSATSARHVLEIGTFTGYSALAMAQAIPPDGRIIACDVNEEWAAIAREHWREAGVSERIDFRLGLAAETLALLERDLQAETFDLVFIDADKPGYDAYYESALRLVRRNGLIILDNTLRRGRVADPNENDPDTVALRKLNTKIANDGRVDSILLPIGTGMTLARRR